MKGKKINIIQLLLSILVFFLIDMFFFKILAIFGLHFENTAYDIANFFKYFSIVLLVFIIYRKEIITSKNKFNRTFIKSLVYSIVCFIFLIFITVILHNFLNKIGADDGINIEYNFTNYFNQKFTLSFIVNLIKNCIFIPFLLCIIFCLGISNVFKKYLSASLVSGLIYGILYGISLNTSFKIALFNSFIPACIVFLLVYLYKTDKNILTVYITYICYVLFGCFIINYII